MDRRRCRSSAVPWRFMATSQAPVAKPRTTSPTTTGATPATDPTATVARPAPNSTPEAATVRREPNRATTGRDSGSAVTHPADTDSSTMPSVDGSSCN